MHTTTKIHKYFDLLIPYLEQIADEIKNGKFKNDDEEIEQKINEYTLNILKEFVDEQNNDKISLQKIYYDHTHDEGFPDFPKSTFEIFVEKKLPVAPMSVKSKELYIEKLTESWRYLTPAQKRMYYDLEKTDKDRFMTELEEYYGIYLRLYTKPTNT